MVSLSLIDCKVMVNIALANSAPHSHVQTNEIALVRHLAEVDASSADIRKAYRKLSLILHPDKNKDENAETQFRQLVAIYEILKDEERRRRYDDILINGLPDWRQPVFYYRRVRKMSNAELALLLFIILTVGHYAVVWSIYLEKQLDELLSRKKREKKKKAGGKNVDEVKLGVDRNERLLEKPQWRDLLPCKLGIWFYLTVKGLPQLIQVCNIPSYLIEAYSEEELKSLLMRVKEENSKVGFKLIIKKIKIMESSPITSRQIDEEEMEEARHLYVEYKETKMKEKEEALARAETETLPKEKKPKVKKPKSEYPVYTVAETNAFVPSYDHGTSIEEIEEQMDDWLEDRNKSLKKKASLCNILKKARKGRKGYRNETLTKEEVEDLALVPIDSHSVAFRPAFMLIKIALDLHPVS
ncbi:hypothetical protein EYD10_08142 [Varanus komodoensis]|nr:hypothetical protein EYD10_08142 [Varanus komodoensis]